MSVSTYSANDYGTLRQRLFDRTKAAVEESFPVSNDRYTLAVSDLKYTGSNRYSLKEQKKAIQEGTNLARRLVGKWQVVDNTTGQVVSKSNPRTIMNVPYLTDRGTFIRNGTEYIGARQLRLSPNVYTRLSDDGSIESQFNVKPRTGYSFKIAMDPQSSVFYLRSGGRKVPFLPVAQAMGVTPDTLRTAWGDGIYQANAKHENSSHATRFIHSLLDRGKKKQETDDGEKEAALDEQDSTLLRDYFSRMELDEEGTRATLGQPYGFATPAAMLAATNKIIGVARGERDTDDRDSLEFQTIHDVSDFIPEKVRNDQQGIVRQLMWRLTSHNGDVSKIPPSILDKHNDSYFNVSGLANAAEEINPMELYDRNQRVVRLGEGGISSVQAVPKEARQVQPSYLGFIDSVRAPESLRIGVDMQLARDVRKGDDNRLYSQFINPVTNKIEWVDQKTASRSVVAFPEFLTSNKAYVPAMVGSSGIQYVPRNAVNFVVRSGDSMLSEGASLVPLKSGVKTMRLLMGSKMASQALPLKSREAPLVQTMSPSGKSVEEDLGPAMGAIRMDKPGVVKAVHEDHVDVLYDDGTEGSFDLYRHFPYARKTFIDNNPVVKAGQRIPAGGLLATSNYTDDKGKASLGLNMRVAYLPYKGLNFEDAVVISESAAKRMTSENMYSNTMEPDKDTEISRDRYLARWPGKYRREQLSGIDKNGVIRPGTVLKEGDPMLLAIKRVPPSPDSLSRSTVRDQSLVWEHHNPGVVTDVVKTRKGVSIYVRSNEPMQIGDKLAGRYGNKGTVADIVADGDMPQDAKGNPYEILLHPLGVITRTNSSQMIEAALGKVANKTGVPYVLPGFMDEDMVDLAKAELKKNNLSDKEDVHDPTIGKVIPGVLTGNAYFYKLHHTAEKKGKSRSVAGYTQDAQPAKGGPDGAKHMGDMEFQALLAHGASDIIKDIKIVKGQRNDTFWRQMKLGQTPVMPGTPEVYDKFRALIRAAGVDLREGKNADNIQAMTNERANQLTEGRQITNPGTYGANTLRPIEGGLFDPDATGSTGNGDRWAYIELPEPVLNPIMEEPVRSLLGYTNKQLDDLVFGETSVEGKRGSAALRQLLSGIDLKSMRAAAIADVKGESKTRRDAAIKRLGYIEAFLRTDTHPEQFLMKRVPVLPPKYRPISRVGDMTMVADPNYMYKAMLESIEDYKDSSELPDELRSEARGSIVKNYRALIGMTAPEQPKLEQKNIGGILQQLLGKSGPKSSFVRRRVMGTNIDMSGLGVVTPNPALKLNEVGLPEDKAWELYSPFIIRYLVQHGTPATEAAKGVADRTERAYNAMKEVVKDRPVLVNRAPTLHKYSIYAAYPVLTKGQSLQVSPAIVKPLGMDFDGDTGSYSVPVSDAAVREAKRLMLPERTLLSTSNDRPNYTPAQEYLAGLWLATKDPSSKTAKRYASVAEAKAAYKRGEISIDDPIVIAK